MDAPKSFHKNMEGTRSGFCRLCLILSSNFSASSMLFGSRVPKWLRIDFEREVVLWVDTSPAAAAASNSAAASVSARFWASRVGLSDSRFVHRMEK